MKRLLIFCYLISISMGCKDLEDAPIPDTVFEENSPVDELTIVGQLRTSYELMPEAAIAINADSSVYAQYTNPTTRYAHGILGDQIEAGQLVVVVDSQFYELTLSDEFVFEDIRPRLADVDQDGQLEFITIRTKINAGGGIAIYKVGGERLFEFAFVPEIGLSNRWLNIAAIDDLDEDGVVDLAWIQTPHIGGILKVAPIQPGQIKSVVEARQYSNHVIGARNLCLSVLTASDSTKILFVPNQSRNKIVGFSFANNLLNVVEEIDQSIDFTIPLFDQYPFINLIDDTINCIQ